MGETADQTLAELKVLRTKMSADMSRLRQAAKDNARSLAPVGAGLVAIGAAVCSVLVVLRRRRKAQERSMRGRLKKLSEALEAPGASVAALGQATREKVRTELRKELAVEPARPPLAHKLAEVAVRSAVGAGVPFLLKTLTRKATGSTGTTSPKA